MYDISDEEDEEDSELDSEDEEGKLGRRECALRRAPLRWRLTAGGRAGGQSSGAGPVAYAGPNS